MQKTIIIKETFVEGVRHLEAFTTLRSLLDADGIGILIKRIRKQFRNGNPFYYEGIVYRQIPFNHNRKLTAARHKS